jgi:hypothetical protein
MPTLTDAEKQEVLRCLENRFDFVYVDEESFEKFRPSSFRELEASFRSFKNAE